LDFKDGIYNSSAWEKQISFTAIVNRIEAWLSDACPAFYPDWSFDSISKRRPEPMAGCITKGESPELSGIIS
jgi:hypothetical protein